MLYKNNNLCFWVLSSIFRAIDGVIVFSFHVGSHLDTVFIEFLHATRFGAALVGDTKASSSGIHQMICALADHGT